MNKFDRIAQYYDRLAVLVYGHAIKEAQTRYLNRIPENATILVLGGGTGWWLKELLKKNTTCTVWYVEASLNMIQCAMKDSIDFSRVKFIHGTHENIPCDVIFDVVISFFFFDLFNNNMLTKIINHIRQKMHRKSIWLVSDFVNKKKWHAIMLFVMYNFFYMIGVLDNKSLPDWESIIKDKNTHLTFFTSYYGKFIKSHLYICE